MNGSPSVPARVATGFIAMLITCTLEILFAIIGDGDFVHIAVYFLLIVGMGTIICIIASLAMRQETLNFAVKLAIFALLPTWVVGVLASPWLLRNTSGWPFHIAMATTAACLAYVWRHPLDYNNDDDDDSAI